MRYICNLLKSDLIPSRNLIPLTRRLQSTLTTSTDTENSLPIEEDEPEQTKLIKKSVNRNKSRLQPQHRNILMDKNPYNEPIVWFHLTEKYQRKMFGKYGLDSNVDPRICFYTKEQKALNNEYERIAYPYTIQEMMKINEKQKEAERLAIQKREDDVAKKLNKLEQWKSELNAKIVKKETEALEAKQRKERLVEEVRRHFGFKVDPRDERFKELLEQKEKEDRKKQKEAKKKAKEAKMMAKLVDSTSKDKELENIKKDSESNVQGENQKNQKKEKNNK